MKSLKPRKPTRRRIDAKEQQLFLAALLVGHRIVTGMTDEEIAVKMGILHREKLPRTAKRRAARIAELVRAMELKMADTRISAYQRYAGSVGLGFDVRLYAKRRPNAVRRTRAIRHRRKALAKRLGQPRRRLVL